VLFGAAYFACAEGSTLLSAKGSPDMSFWLPSGLYVAVLLHFEYKSWPGLMLSAIAANVAFDMLHGTQVLAILLFVGANTTEAVLGAWLVRTFVAKRPTIATLREFAGLLALAGVLSTGLGAAISATGQTLLGMTQSWSRTFEIWWGSTAMATLILSPFVLAWCSNWPDRRAFLRRPKKFVEAAVVFVVLIVTTWWILVLGGGINSPNKSPLLLCLFWAGLRFGVRGATAANLVLSLLAGFCTQHYLKGLTSADLASRGYVLTLQISLAVGSVVGLIPAIVLAEHDRTLEELRKSEERYQLAVRGSTDGIWDWNILTNDVFYSDRYRELLGYAREEFPAIFASFESVLHPDDADRILKLIETHLKQGAPLDVEFRLRTKMGDYRWFRGRGQAIWNEQRQPVRMAGSITDITLGKLSEQLILESEEKFSKAFRSSPNGIAITELETGRYIEVNDSFSQIYGYAKAEMLGRTSLELGVFQSVADRERFLELLRPTGHIKDYELRMSTRTREPRTLLASAERIVLGGKQCMVVVLFDITSRLQTEERLEKTSRQLRALTSRLRSLQEEERTHLAREIHDHLGQLLTALSLDLRLIERKLAGVADPDLRTALTGKISSARILADETIISVQKIASELRPAILDRLGLEAAIESEAQAFQSRTGIDCQWTLPTNPVSLGADQATGVFRIFQEILTNVARHSQASRLAVRLASEDHELLLEVEDDGIGIQPADITKPTSLGLLGMRERVVILGGQITFIRNSPRGTKVLVQIPLNGKVGPVA
jgi:PAS domain S-box-containing protein